MPEPEGGHGALIAITLDPVASPNVFTTILHQTGNNPFKFTRGSTETTPHNFTWDYHIVSRVRMRDVIPVTGNYIHGDSTHDGVRDLVLTDPPTTVGFRLTGPSGSATDAVQFSGQFLSWGLDHPRGDGVRTFTADFRPSGNEVRVDGDLIA